MHLTKNATKIDEKRTKIENKHKKGKIERKNR